MRKATVIFVMSSPRDKTHSRQTDFHIILYLMFYQIAAFLYDLGARGGAVG